MQFLDIPFKRDDDDIFLKSDISSSIPIIDDLTDKEIIVTKFISSLSSFPIFIPELAMNKDNKLQTVYSFILCQSNDNENINIRSNISYVMLNQENKESIWEDSSRQPTNKMCFINSYSNIAYMLNNAIQTALTNIKTNPSFNYADASLNLYFNAQTEKFVFRLENIEIFSATNPYQNLPHLSIYFSENMTFMFSGLTYISDNKIPGYNRLILQPSLNNVMIDSSGILVYGIQSVNPIQPQANSIYEVTNDFSIASNFTSIKNILITTSLGILDEKVEIYSNQTNSNVTKMMVPDPQNPGKSKIIDVYNSNTKTFSQLILLDLSFDNSIAMGSSQSVLSYNNNIIDVSRRVKVLQSGPLYSLSIQVLYVDCFGNIRPFEVNSKSSVAALKLCFI